MSSDVENTTPFGESTSSLLESSGTFGKLVEPLGGSLSNGSSQWDNSEIELDSWDDSLLDEKIGELLSLIGALMECLLVENHSGDVLVEIWSSEQELTILLTICLVVFEVDGIKTLSDCASGFIGGEDSLSILNNFESDLVKLVFLSLGKRVLGFEISPL